MKITVIGGGSSYTPELVKGLIDRKEDLPVDELWLMDIDAHRLEIVGGFIQRMAAANGDPFEVIFSESQLDAVRDASYVVTQMRVGQMAARRGDEYLGKRHGLIGQETTGVGGMAKALRTIPVILSIAEDMKAVAAPNALLLNFTNPAGLVTQALAQYGAVESVGVCNVPITTAMNMIELLEKKLGEKIDPGDVQLDTLGLNHLSWHRGLRVAGIDRWPEILEALVESSEEEEPAWPGDVLQVLGMLPNYYLQYFYYTDHKLEEQDAWPPSRAEEVMEVEKDLLKQYADPTLDAPPEDLMKRGGAYYSTAATQLINSHYNDLGETHVVNLLNKGAVAEWPDEWVLEMPAKVSRSTITPLPAKPLPHVCFGLIAQVKSYELLTVEAAVHGDREAAYQALLAHPLGPSADQIQAVLEDMLETNHEWLPQFEL